MANFFTLTANGETKPAVFQDIDDRMREALGEPADPKHWLYEWYDTVGLGLAMGYDWEKMRTKIFHDSPELLRVIDWLEENYTPDSWAGR